jgi:RimJ/RimL family protein N-acetyltransferase
MRNITPGMKRREQSARSIMNEGTSFPVEIRRLWPSDKEVFRDHLLRLDPRSRHLRFGGGMSDEFLVHYAENCFGKGDLVYGAFLDGKMIGAAELRSNQPIWSEQAPFARDIHAEAAFSVEEGYRRRGIGEKLFKQVVRAAAHHGVETIEIVCLPDNIGMQNLAKKFDTHFKFEENSLIGRLTVPQPTARSLMQEASADAADFSAALFDSHWRAVAEARQRSLLIRAGKPTEADDIGGKNRRQFSRFGRPL